MFKKNNSPFEGPNILFMGNNYNFCSKTTIIDYSNISTNNIEVPVNIIIFKFCYNAKIDLIYQKYRETQTTDGYEDDSSYDFE